MRIPSLEPSPAVLYATCLEQCEWADGLGFDAVDLGEHHGQDDGYNPSGFVLAAAIAGRTQKIRIRLSALILPLHDPIRVAEDAAVVDILSSGRLDLIIGAGYV